jgi:acyl-coenzyme A synthetase/AMP-(fatty) acid ligase
MNARTLIGAWAATVRRAPDATALIEAASGRVTSRGELDALAAAWCAAHSRDRRGQTVLFGEPNGREWFAGFLGLLKSGAVIALHDPGEPAEARRALAAAAARGRREGRRLLKMTSGSTGAPRAFAFTDAQLLADGRQVGAAMGIGAEDLNYALIPFGHSYGLGNLVVPLLAQGTAIVVGSSPWPHAIAAEVARWRPTVFPGVPPLLAALARADVAPENFRSLRTVISAGAPLAAETAQAFHARFGLKIHGFYGSSETGGIAYDREGDATLAGRSVGPPLPGVRLRFGRAGRFTVTGPAVLGRGGFRPADRGELNEHGELVLLGRVPSFVKVAGRRLSLAEVESALKALPGVRDALVRPHAARPDQLLAAVATDRPADELRAELRTRLAAWKIPRRLATLAEFPTTARGKTDTRRLTEWLQAPPKGAQPSSVASISSLSTERQISA